MEHCNKSRSADLRLAEIQGQIRQAAQDAGRDPGSVRLIAVSKGQGPDKIVELARGGVLDFGENYLQEWETKTQEIARMDPALGARLRWHFIGHLQSNKIKQVVGMAATIHSVDNLRLAAKISQNAATRGITQAVLWEIKLAEEAAKSGLRPEDWLRDLPGYAALPNLSWQGLMVIPPPVSDAVGSRPYFDRLKSLLDEGNRTGVLKQSMTELSMGMSQDFAQAIAAGATMVRIGTALFGPRA
jgi:pyridoxal phosphate enzyme, YggS family